MISRQELPSLWFVDPGFFGCAFWFYLLHEKVDRTHTAG